MAVLLAAPDSLADVALRPAEDGRLGAWLVAGPLPGAAPVRSEPRRLPCFGQMLTDAGGPRWRVLAGAASGIDLTKELGVKDREGAQALASVALELEQDLKGWLLLSADGGAKVWVDGHPIWARDVDRLRGRSWDSIPLELARGSHRLLLGLQQYGPDWAFAVRILDQADLRPPKNLRWVLPGTSPVHEAQLRERMVEAGVAAVPQPDGYHVRVHLDFPGGFPAGAAVPVRISLRPEGATFPKWEGALGSLAPSEQAMHHWDAALPRIVREQVAPGDGDRRWEILIQLGRQRILRTLILNRKAPLSCQQAAQTQAGLREQRFPALLDPRALEGTLELFAERLGESGSSPAAGSPASWIRRIETMVTALERGEDPMVRPGVQELARWSALDGRPTPMLLHVPRGYVPGASQRFPLVVLLHGYRGTPQSVLSAFFDTKSMAPQPKIDGFVLAPHAYGNSFYRGPGEQDVLDALDWAMKHYPIDAHRVSITGVSMGGTGAAHLGLLYAEKFSAAAPLCGYHSYFLRRDTAQRPLRPWEIHRMHHWSPASWAPNGRHLALLVAQGTRDHPLSNSRVLVDAYRSLDYPVREEWPDTGHAVWEYTYAGQRLWPWLSHASRTPGASRLTLTTDALRYGSHDWVQVTALDRSRGFARLEAERVSPDRVILNVQGVTGFELDRDRGHLAATDVTVQVNGSVMSFDHSERLNAHREGNAWHKGAPVRGKHAKRSGLEGPLDDALLGPLVFVYGTLDSRWALANREVALALARQRTGVQIRYPVVSDLEFDPALADSHSLVLVGNRQTHSLLRRLDRRLPIGIEAESVRIGSTRHQGPDVGTTFVYPNPEHPDRYLVLVEGAGIPGLYYALALPQLIPDFLVYDSAVAPAAGQQVLGRAAHVLAGGFFRDDWSLPDNVNDPMRP